MEASASQCGLAGPLVLRLKCGAPVVTDGVHSIVDASFSRIPDPNILSDALFAIPGVVDLGLSLGLAPPAIIAGADGIRTMNRP